MLAKRVILVEGPSDELVVQRAYLDAYGRLPIEDGVDVISVRGLQAKRFLDITVPLQKPAAVVNDNDDDHPAAVRAKYANYEHYRFIRICIGEGEARTLEPQLLSVNGREVINRVLGKTFETNARLLTYMKNNETECALKVFESATSITMPEYIRDAIAE